MDTTLITTFWIFLAKRFMHTNRRLQREQPVYRLKEKLWFHCTEMKQLKQLFFWLISRMFWHSIQPIQPVFHNNINRFMYFPQERLLQCFVFRIRSHICLLNGTTNTRRTTQSTLPPTECRIFGTFDPFRTFHPSLHESVAFIDHFKNVSALFLKLYVKSLQI